MRSRLGVVARSALFVAAVVVAPLAVVAVLVEMGVVAGGAGPLLVLVALHLAFLVPVARLYAHWVFLADVRRINHGLARLRLGDYDVRFPVPEERVDEDDMTRLLRNMNWVVRRFRSDLCTLSRHAEELRSMSFRDELTGLGNRRSLERLFHEAACGGESVALALMDLDRFKAVNDTHGHLAGDAVLQTLGRILHDGVRAGVDHPFRLGGDEFGVLFRHAGLAGAVEACRRVAVRFAAANPHGCTASVGVVAMTLGPSIRLDAALARCDEVLYLVKSHGGNDVHGIELDRL